MRLAWVLVVLAGCPWVGGKGFNENVRDVDGDGGIAVRFGGKDCQDDNPEIADCDADGDGVLSALAGGQDCDDTDASVFPGAAERCNGADDDCDGLVDNDDPDTPATGALFVDADGDGAGDPDESRACQEYAVPGDLATGLYVSNSNDCDDSDPTISPSADERCDGFDNNCDGAVDDVGLWFVDADGDGFGLAGTQATGSCDLEPGSGLASQDGDCNDSNSDVYPGATEVPYDGIDGNCNGGLDDWDVDFDGHVPDAHWPAASAANDQRPADQRWDIVAGDCDDLDPARFVGNTEVCDGVDNDCDQAIDVQDLASAGPSDEPTLRAQVQTVFVDQDGDGFHGSAVTLCPAQIDLAIHSTTSTDCFDGGAPPLGLENAVASEVNQGADEQCDGYDNNCDGRVDHSLDPFPELTLHYFDSDDDGFGDGQVYACGDDPIVGIVGVGGDCNDAQPNVFPGAPEICGDAVRQDCSNAGIYDCDGDGFEGAYVGGGSGDDCDDVRAGVFPNNAPGGEICDGLDNDCDGLVDSDDTDNLDAANEPLWYLDADEDGYGLGTDSVQQCDQPDGRVLLDGDCDDGDATLSPATLWYTDADGDGYGQATTGVASCLPPSPDHVRNGADCNDLDPLFNPETQWMLDEDGDLRGAPSTLSSFCAPPAGEPWVLASNGVDCDDTEVSIQGSFTWYRDFDNDAAGDPEDTIEACVQPVVSGVRYVLVPGDCDDMDAARHPQREEVCNGIDDDCDTLTDDADPTLGGVVNGPIGFRDVDGDGFGGEIPKQFCFAVPSGWSTVGGDCDDDEPAAYPGAPEICDNGIDDDCDGSEQVPSWYLDADRDGFGAGPVVVEDCQPPDPVGYASITGDCDDDEPTTFPGAAEVDACDAVDSNCDGEPEPRLTWYFDSDADGFGSDATAFTTCSPPNEPPEQGLTGEWVLQGGDCDDLDPTITFGRIWFRDRDGDTLGNDASTQFYCPQYDDQGEELSVYLLNDVNGNGAFDEGDVQLTVFGGDCNDNNAAVGLPRTYFLDQDGDTWGRIGGQLLCPDPLGNPPAGRVDRSGDCRDDNDQVFPGADEVDGDGLDSNCDGLDNNESGIVWYPDTDGDGFGDRTAVGTTTYVNPSVTNNVDCDDTNADVVNGIFVYTDGDLDSYGAGAPRFVSRCMPTAGESLVATDCDDTDFDRKPGVLEVCDGEDQDCDGLVDEELPTTDAFPDLDGDGFGAGSATIAYCGTEPPAGASDSGDDCDDFDAAIHPDADEVCNGIDDDCTGTADDGLPQVVSYFDGDGDGYGLTAATVSSCDVPTGYVEVSDDCDDSRFAVNPGATEACNGLDDDCDTEVDEDTGTAGFRDLDGDGDGDDAFPTTFCTALPPAGVATTSTDCDDLDPTVYAGAHELCDGKDNDCNGSVEIRNRYYADLDGDGQGAGAYVEDCAQPPGSWSLVSTDCNDADATVFLNAPELCDGKDNACSGSLDPHERDDDRDGWLVCESDCDDQQALRHPGAAELCDGVADNDCDTGTADPEITDADLDGITACYDPDDDDATIPGSGVTWYVDADGDGFGGLPSAVEGEGVLNGLDCDDTRSDVHPGAPFVCEAGVDSDCDGTDDPPNTNWRFDLDGDGAGAAGQVLSTCVDPGAPWIAEVPDADLDCDDGNADVRPGVIDVCNGIDDDCDGPIDEDDLPVVYVLDADGDGFAFEGFGQIACEPPAGPWILETASSGGDCDDTDVAINSDAHEICDGIDNNCNDVIDEGVLDSYSLDRDGDGFLAVGTITMQACAPPGAPWMPTPSFPTPVDCDDDDFGVKPGDAETDVCDGKDNDCSGVVDDGPLEPTEDWYLDADGDGYVASLVSVRACTSPGFGWSQGPILTGDCNDQDVNVNPGVMSEACDNIDSNCNGLADEPLVPWYLDSDGDGNGNPQVSVDACFAPGVRWTNLGDDCDDDSALADPDNTSEVCDGVDTDCDGGIPTDEQDFDGDGYLACDDDCDDFEERRNPGRVETCDGIVDNDCDPTTVDLETLDDDGDDFFFCFDVDDNDPAVPGGGSSDPRWYRDFDGDGYGDPGTFTTADTRPAGHVANSGDCNDGNAAIRPGVDEQCNGIDDNCDGAVADNGDVDVTNPFTHTGLVGFPGAVYMSDLDDDGDFSVRYGFMGCLETPVAGQATFNGNTFDVVALDLDTDEPDLWNYVDCEDFTTADGVLFGPDVDSDGAAELDEIPDLDVFFLDCFGGSYPHDYAPIDDRGFDCAPDDPYGRFVAPDDGTVYYTDDDRDGAYRELLPSECAYEFFDSTSPYTNGLDCDDRDQLVIDSATSPVVVRSQAALDDALEACTGSATVILDNNGTMPLVLDLSVVEGELVFEGFGGGICGAPFDAGCVEIYGYSGPNEPRFTIRNVGLVNPSGTLVLGGGGSATFQEVRFLDLSLDVQGTVDVTLEDVEFVDTTGGQFVAVQSGATITWFSTGILRLDGVSAAGSGDPGGLFLDMGAGELELQDVMIEEFDRGFLLTDATVFGSNVEVSGAFQVLDASNGQVDISGLTASLYSGSGALFDLYDTVVTCHGCDLSGVGSSDEPVISLLDASTLNLLGGSLGSLGEVADVGADCTFRMEDLVIVEVTGTLATNKGELVLERVEIDSTGEPVVRQLGPTASTGFDTLTVRGLVVPTPRVFELYGGSLQGLDLNLDGVEQVVRVEAGSEPIHEVTIDIEGGTWDQIGSDIATPVFLSPFGDAGFVPLDARFTGIDVYPAPLPDGFEGGVTIFHTTGLETSFALEDVSVDADAWEDVFTVVSASGGTVAVNGLVAHDVGGVLHAEAFDPLDVRMTDVEVDGDGDLWFYASDYFASLTLEVNGVQATGSVWRAFNVNGGGDTLVSFDDLDLDLDLQGTGSVAVHNSGAGMTVRDSSIAVRNGGALSNDVGTMLVEDSRVFTGTATQPSSHAAVSNEGSLTMRKSLVANLASSQGERQLLVGGDTTLERVTVKTHVTNIGQPPLVSVSPEGTLFTYQALFDSDTTDTGYALFECAGDDAYLGFTNTWFTTGNIGCEADLAGFNSQQDTGDPMFDVDHIATNSSVGPFYGEVAL